MKLQCVLPMQIGPMTWSTSHVLDLGGFFHIPMITMASSRSSNWSAEEIKTLIQIWAEEDIQEIMSSRKKNTPAYEKMHARMLEAGYQRTKEQVQVSIDEIF